MSQFTCPVCGSNKWGTSSLELDPSPIAVLRAIKKGVLPVRPGPTMGHCHGVGCKFTWDRSVARDAELGIFPPSPEQSGGWKQ